MIAQSPVHDTRFIAGDSEMGALIRAKDWSKTSLGTFDQWPQSLRTALSIILLSKFPMFLWWGPNLICFYNDAYRPSLGDQGKHPSILGQRAEEAWPEIWDIIKPLIDQVLAGGEATWSKDQLIPIFRNGRMEDVYWTFSYSAVIDESGEPAGVLVTCSETTEIVHSFRNLEQSNRRYFNDIMQAPVAMCILRGRNYIVEIANSGMLELWGKTSADMLNKPVFEGLPEAKGQGLEQLLDNVYNTGDNFIANERAINFPRGEKIETTYINFVYKALREPDGVITGIVAIASDVSMQVVARKKVEENEEKLNVVINASGLGTWELNLQTNEIIYSDRYIEIMGYDAGSRLDHSQMLKHLHPQDLEIRNKAFEEALITSVLYYEARLIWKDQSVHWMEVKGKVFYDNENHPLKLVGTIRDITGEKKRQQILKDSEEKFRLLADSMPQHIWTADPMGNLNYFNRSVFDFTGLSGEAFAREGWQIIVHPDDQAENIQKWRESVEYGRDFLLEHRFRRHDGEYRWQLSRAIPQKDSLGNIRMWVGISTEIHIQKEQALEMEKLVEERTAELLQANESLQKSNLENTLSQYNKRFLTEFSERFSSYTPNLEFFNSLVKYIADLTRLDYVFVGKLEQSGNDFFIQTIAITAFGKLVDNIVYSLPDGPCEQVIRGTLYSYPDSCRQLFPKNQTLIQFNVEGYLGYPLFDAHGNAMGIIAVMHEKIIEDPETVSSILKIVAKRAEIEMDRIKYEETLKQNNIKLEKTIEDLDKMNAELQSFAYVSSHDLQEPLRKIQTFSGLILEKDHQNLSQAGKDYFRRMQESTKRMQTLIEDLLAYSRTNTNKRNEVIDLNEVLELVKADLTEDMQQKHAVIRSSGLIKANMIPFQIRQLLNNLIGNSLKFSRPDVAPVILVTGTIEGRDKINIPVPARDEYYYHLSVSDNGIGFDPVYKERIFEVFQRLHGKSEFKGTGIGLAIVKKIVENHHGYVTATGMVNQGSAFDIYFPMSQLSAT